METIARAAAIYFFLMIIFIFAGRRSLAKITTFDFVLLLILGECTQQALIGSDYSISTAFILITSLIGLEILMSNLRNAWPVFDKVIAGEPLVIAQDGKCFKDRLAKEKILEKDIMMAARQSHGLQRFDQIKYAILETNGEISIVPQEK